MSSQPLLFVIVGKNEPLYEAEFNKLGSSSNSGGNNNNTNNNSSNNTTTPSNSNNSNSISSDSITRQNYFVLHSSLDLVEKAAWTTSNMYLRTVDKVNHQQVSTFLTAGNIKFMLLHSGKGDDAIKNFFLDVYELYVKLSMNPFYRYDTPITSEYFDAKVMSVARRYLS